MIDEADNFINHGKKYATSDLDDVCEVEMKGKKNDFAKQIKKNTIIGKSIHLNTKAAAQLQTMEPSKRTSQDGFSLNRITLDIDSA